MQVESWHEGTGCSVVFGDDGRVGWAFLRDPEGLIIADVWLYNRVEPPGELDLSQSAPPFLNPAPFAKPLDQPPPQRKAEDSIVWTLESEVLMADVFLRGALLGRLTPGSQPGWAMLARVDGPLARAFDE